MDPVKGQSASLHYSPLGALDSGPLKKLELGSTLRRYRRGELLFAAGEQPLSVYLVLKGMLKLVRNRPQGPRIVRLLLPGEMIGMASILAGRPYTLSAIALDSGEARVFDAHRFVGTIHTHHAFCHAVLRQLAEDLTEARVSLALQGDVPVQARLADLLLKLHARLQARTDDPGADLEIRLTRYDLAELLGSAQETISRALGRLEEAKLINRKGRSILVKNEAGLHDLAQSAESLPGRLASLST